MSEVQMIAPIRTWWRYWVSAALVTGVVLFTSCSRQSNEIRIGWIGPLTGDAAPYGVSIQNGTNLAVAKINSAGGIRGKKVRIVYEDDQATPRLGTAAMQKLVAFDKPPVIIQAAASSVMVANIPTAEANHVVYISPSCSSDKIREEKIRLNTKYIFRTWPSDSYQGEYLAQFAFNQLHAKNAGILYISNEYGAGMQSAFAAAFKRLGGHIVSQEAFSQGASDFRTQLTKLKQQAPPVILLASHYEEAAQILRQAKELGLKSQFIADAALFSPELLKLAGKAANGLILTNPDWNPASEKPRIKNFVDSYSTAYHQTPDVYAASGYDLMMLLGDVMKSTGTSADQIRRGLVGIRGYDGVTCRIEFDKTGEVQAQYALYEIQHMTFVPYE